MTTVEAMARMKKRAYEGLDGDHDDIYIALYALEKQIPKKPICNNEEYYCPECGDFAEDNYCGNCGQKILWDGTV